MSHDILDEIKQDISNFDGTCYSDESVCEIIDNYVFRTQGGDTYELFLNAASGCCVNATNVGYTKRYNRTFKENDPIRQMADGYPPEHAAFQGKVDGGDFIPNVCTDIEYFSDLNVEPINLYNYRLSTLQTEYITTTSDISAQTIHEKRDVSLGEVWCRNTLSTEIKPIHELLPSIQQYPEIYNNIVDFNVIYDTIFVYTHDKMYMDRISYNYNTGNFSQSPVAPIIIESSAHSKNIKPFFNENKREVVLGRVVKHENEYVPELHRYNLDTGGITVAYGPGLHAVDYNRYRLPRSVTDKYMLHTVSDTHLTYNETLHKYTVTITARLSANRSTIIDSPGELYGENIFAVLIYNYKDMSEGLKLLDSSIYMPRNTKSLGTEFAEANRTVMLEGRGTIISLQDVSDSKTQITIDPKHVQVREHKLKEIRYTYRGNTTTKTRLPVNDMYYADIPDVMSMVESYKRHRCGGPIDFASPRYHPVTIDLDLNLEEISMVEIKVEAIYYDGHIEEWRINGEAKPLSLDDALKGFRLIDTKSYTTETHPCLLKLIFESKEPNLISEFILDNNNSREVSVLNDFNLLTVSGSGLSGTNTPSLTS